VHDYFARPDSGIRHYKERISRRMPQHVLKTRPGRRSRLSNGSSGNLNRSCSTGLRNGEDIGSGFSKIVNKVLTNTSKKVSKQGEPWLEADSWAAELF